MSISAMCVTATHYESKAYTLTSDRECLPLKVCLTDDPATEYISQQPTYTTNRECSMLAVCDGTTNFQSTAPTTTSNRVCSPLTDCSASGMVVDVPGDTLNDNTCGCDTMDALGNGCFMSDGMGGCVFC